MITQFAGPAEDHAASTAPDAIDRLRAIGREFHARGWSLGTSSNYSVVASRDPLELLITASGRDKSGLGRDDFVRVDAEGRVTDGSGRPASAETLLHCTIAAMLPEVGAVLHTHSVWATILSAGDGRPGGEAESAGGSLRIAGYEMLKGLAGIHTHDVAVEVPILPNTQDMPALARDLPGRIGPAAGGGSPSPHAFLLRRHGLYTWGRDLAEARRHVEILEFLFEAVARSRMLPPGSTPPDV
jgi:methylthioribulose-1-phosphate dehydratase